MYDQGTQAPSIQIRKFIQWAFSLLIFVSKVFFRVKTGEVKVDCYLKTVQ